MSEKTVGVRLPDAAEGPDMIAAMRRGVAEALAEHKRQGRSVVTWDQARRRVVVIPADQIPVLETAPPEPPSS